MSGTGLRGVPSIGVAVTFLMLKNDLRLKCWVFENMCYIVEASGSKTHSGDIASRGLDITACIYTRCFDMHEPSSRCWGEKKTSPYSEAPKSLQVVQEEYVWLFIADCRACAGVCLGSTSQAGD